MGRDADDRRAEILRAFAERATARAWSASGGIRVPSPDSPAHLALRDALAAARPGRRVVAPARFAVAGLGDWEPRAKVTQRARVVSTPTTLSTLSSLILRRRGEMGKGES